MGAGLGVVLGLIMAWGVVACNASPDPPPTSAPAATTRPPTTRSYFKVVEDSAYVVGTTIPAGQWSTDGGASWIGVCSWSVEYDGVVVEANTGTGPFTVDLDKPGMIFTTARCGSWIGVVEA